MLIFKQNDLIIVLTVREGIVPEALGSTVMNLSRVITVLARNL